MEIINKKTPEISRLYDKMNELHYIIKTSMEKRTPHLNGEKCLTNKDVCEQLHLSLRTLQEYRDSGKIGYIQISGKILYRESDILKLLNDNYYPKYTPDKW